MRQGSIGDAQQPSRYLMHHYRTLAVVLLLALPGAVSAQDSREALIAAAQADKATRLAPYTPTRAERLLAAAGEALSGLPKGFYPIIGSVYGGGGFTPGLGYRQYYGDRTHWDARALYSVENYALFELSTDAPGLANDRIGVHLRGGWRDATQVGYYGIGTDTPRERSNYRFSQTYAAGDVAWNPAWWTPIRGGASYEHFALDEGQGQEPSIEEVHSPASAPGLGLDHTYLHLTGSAGIDWRPAPGYARRGGLYQVAYHNYADVDGEFGFDRLDAEVIQHLPILRENWVISLRGRVQTTLGDTDAVPFFLLPSLGSGSTLRGYSSGRFRDRHSLLMNAEWRWIPSRLAMDMAIFYDAGKVAPEWDGLGLFNLNRSVGVGVRLHTLVATPIRIEFAKGTEGLRLVISGHAAF